MAKYVNYGDVNPVEHGGLFIALDEEVGEGNCFYVVEINKFDDIDDSWLFQDSYIDLNDVSEQQYKEASDGIDFAEDETDSARRVSYLVSYFGHNTFSDGHEQVIKGEEDLKEELLSYGIIV
jgi:hypothetical protein